MTNISIFVENEEQAQLLADFIVPFTAARPRRMYHSAPPAAPAEAAEAPAPAASEPPKRTRRTKAEIEAEKAAATAAPVEEAQPTPEPIPEQTQEPGAAVADLFAADAPADAPAEARVFTPEDVKAAMTRYVEKHGMDAAQKNGPTLVGFERLSLVPNDATVCAAAVARIEAATAKDAA